MRAIPFASLCSMLAIFTVAVSAHYGWWVILGGALAGVLLGVSHAYAAAFG